MASLKASSLILNSSSLSSKQTPVVKAFINLPNRVARISLPGRGFTQDVDLHKLTEKQLSPVKINTNGSDAPDPIVLKKLYAMLEAVADRVEMHKNIGDQRNNWNTLLLTSINSITLAAATMPGIAAISGGGSPTEALKLSSTVMYVAATGMLSVVNKIQPSQLAEEQRNATRLFKQLRNQIQMMISIGNPTRVDVKQMMDRVLALDKAYPLPLLGVMLEKFPETVEPAVWWPEQRRKQSPRGKRDYNGWNGKLEEEMREVVKVLKTKDEEDYLRLGEKAVKFNKFLAIAGPVLTGLGAVGSALSSHGGWAAVVGVMGGALASVVNSLEHGGQVGMVFEMYRSNAGFFKMMEESIEWNLREEDMGRRENGEVLEMKVGLQLGRSLSQLRDLGENHGHEFGSKLF